MDAPLLEVIALIVVFTAMALAATKALTPGEPSKPVAVPTRPLPETVRVALEQLHFERKDWIPTLLDGPVTIRALSAPFRLSAEGRIPKNVQMALAGSHDAEELADHLERTPTGDRAFDADIHMTGDPIWMCAVLDSGTRTTLRNYAARMKLQIVNGVAVWTSEKPEPDRETISEAMRLLGAVVRLFSIEEESAETAAAANLLAEPDPLVRQQIVRALATRRHSSAAVGALQRACDDRDLQVRMLAAKLHPCEAGQAALRAIAFDRSVDEAFRRVALRAFADHTASQEAATLAASIVDAATPELSREALDLAGREPVDQEAVRALATSSRADIRLAAVPHLDGATPAGEAALVARLEDGETRVALAAIDRLRITGTLSAVAPLSEIAGALLGNAGIKTAARAAIEEIQLRANGAAGSVSLADPDERGRLSAAAQAGTLATPDGKRRG